MTSNAFFKTKVQGQMIGRLTNPLAGLNTFNPSVAISDNHLSDCRDVVPYRNAALKLYAPLATVADRYANGTDIRGEVKAAIADGGVSEEYVYLLVIDGSTGYIVQTDLTLGPITKYDVTSLGVPSAAVATAIYSACLFSTEAKNYVVFADSSLAEIIYFDGTGVDKVVTPFKPKKLAAYANRIFAIDDKNKLWWCTGGNLATWYGSSTTNPYANEDAGYWTVEAERMLSELCVLNGALYIFGVNGIYVFRGYDYDTFSLTSLIPGVGTSASAGRQLLVGTKDLIFFISPNYDAVNSNESIAGADIYQFNGNSMPTVISRPVVVNNQLSNGVQGGIYNTDLTHLTADENFLYLYKKSHLSTDANDTDILMYDIKAHSWWKRSGFNDDHADISNTFNSFYFPCFNRSTVHAICSDLTTTKYWHIFNDIGFTGTASPFVITKAFNVSPTDKETLTAIILYFQSSAAAAVLNIKVEYSLTSASDDFLPVYDKAGYITTGDVETIDIPMPVPAICNCHHYRIKITVFGGICYLHNIERRFRTYGRTR